jgi:hypothetical protein
MMDKNAYKFLIKSPVGKKPLRKPSCKWKDIEMTLK